MEMKKIILIIIILITASCALTVKKSSIPTIAVWDIEDVSISPLPMEKELSKLLSQEIIKAVQDTHKYRLIERQKLLLVLEELNLATSDLVDPQTQLKLGKILGANFMLFSGYQVIGDKIRFDLRLVKVETGEIIKAKQKTLPYTSNWQNYLKIIYELTKKILD